MLRIQTSRFGSVEVDEGNIIEMKAPILGFVRLNKFAIIIHENESPFQWLQSIEDGSIAFIIVDPFLIKHDYEPEINDQVLDMLEVKQSAGLSLMAIVTIRPEPTMITVNLRAPLVINKQRKMAGQVVLANEEYPVQYEVT